MFDLESRVKLESLRIQPGKALLYAEKEHDSGDK
jgi:hypothetical protein